MTIANAEIAFILGFSATGDFGYTSWYTRANGSKVCFAKFVLDGKRKTPARVAQRDRWRLAAATWQILTKEQKENWIAAAKKLSLPVTGYNLFMWWQMSGDDGAIKTVEHQSGYSLI